MTRNIAAAKTCITRKDKHTIMLEEIVRYESIYHTMVSLDIKYLKSNDLEINYHKYNKYDFVKDIPGMSPDIFNEIVRMKRNRSQKRCRYKSKVYRMIELADSMKRELGVNPKLVFATMTLNDKSLNQKEETRLKKISKWTKKHFAYAIVNKDFGKKNEREHYHLIGITYELLEDTGKKSKKGYKEYRFKNQDYKCGFEPTMLMINYKDTEKMNSYLLKLNNHSNKDTTKANRIRVFGKKIYKDFMDIKI